MSYSTNKDAIITGYWHQVNMEDPDFSDLSQVTMGEFDLQEFLHGWCSIFAMALHDLYGYPVVCLADCEEVEEYGVYDISSSDYPIIHAFCVNGDAFDENTLYVDCRGITSDHFTFKEEFRDFFTEYVISQYTNEQLAVLKKDIWENALGQDLAERYYHAAVTHIKAHEDYYKIEER